MRTKEEILMNILKQNYTERIFKFQKLVNHELTLKAMQEYAEECHQSELLKLNKSDVISLLRQCSNCVHYRDNFDCDTCNEHLDKWQSNGL